MHTNNLRLGSMKSLATKRFYHAACNADAVFCPSVRSSVCLSVCLLHAWIVTERKKDLSKFLYDTKDNLA